MMEWNKTEVEERKETEMGRDFNGKTILTFCFQMIIQTFSMPYVCNIEWACQKYRNWTLLPLEIIDILVFLFFK